MDMLTCHGMFARRTDRSVVPVRVEADFGNGRPVDVWASVMTAAVSLSGRLDECLTDEDLDDAALSYLGPIPEFVTGNDEALTRETAIVLAELMDAGLRVEFPAGIN